MRKRTEEIQLQNSEVKIDKDDVVIDWSALLGRGGFAKVYKGTYRGTHTIAVKVLSESTPAHVSCYIYAAATTLTDVCLGSGRGSKRLEGTETSQHSTVPWILINLGIGLHGVRVESEWECARILAGKS